MTNYALNNQAQTGLQWNKFYSFLKGDIPRFLLAIGFALFTTAVDIATPLATAVAIDKYISKKDPAGLLLIIGVLAVAYIIRIASNFLQTRIMGHVSQDTLYKLREAVFKQLQKLPISFFNQNKAGDLTSRINNDTDKMNTFLSESVIRFVASFFAIIGTGVIVVYLNPKLGLITISVSLVLYFISRTLTPILKQKNKEKLAVEGKYSAQVQESLNNFRVIVAFNRKDYFENKLAEINQEAYKKGLWASILNESFKPIYDFAANIAQMVVLIFGLYFITQGELSIGFLIAYISYTQKFYDPLRILGVIWGNIQSAFAAWSRLQDILNLETDLKIISKNPK